MLDAARAADVADCARRLARRHPDWFPALSVARQEALATMFAEVRPADHEQWRRVLELVARADYQAAAAAMATSDWRVRYGQRAWRACQAMRAGIGDHVHTRTAKA